ncbi:MAG: hypothetical protein M0Z51_07570 [Propionibacterium sp.]|nr:hypothetical protein [Propionibacterium sp.]
MTRAVLAATFAGLVWILTIAVYVIASYVAHQDLDALVVACTLIPAGAIGIGTYRSLA